jgi:hypothetical protein
MREGDQVSGNGNGNGKPVVQLLITGDLKTGSVEVDGPITDSRLWQWLLGEARRICEREADKRDAKAIAAAQSPAGLVLPRVGLRP